MTDEQKKIQEDKWTAKGFDEEEIKRITDDLEDQISSYNSVNAASNTFKNRKFKPTTFDDSSGRVTKIVFEAESA